MSEQLIRACATVDGVPWKDLTFVFGIRQDDRLEIERSSDHVAIRRRKVLERWKQQAKSPTVRILLELFQDVDVCRRDIEEKYNHYLRRRLSFFLQFIDCELVFY